MLIRPCLGVEVPEMTVQVARASNPAGTTAMWVRAGSTVCGMMRTSLAGIPARARSARPASVTLSRTAVLPFPGRPARGNRPGSGRTQGHARSAQP